MDLREFEMSIPRQNPPTVLHVEDDETTAYLFQRAIQAIAPETHLIRVADGDECLAFLLRRGVHASAAEPDAIVLDLNLPKRNGFQVLEALSQIYDLRRLPVVVFSGSLDVRQETRILTLGARKSFSKNRGWDSFREVAEFVWQALRKT